MTPERIKELRAALEWQWLHDGRLGPREVGECLDEIEAQRTFIDHIAQGWWGDPFSQANEFLKTRGGRTP